MCVCILYGELSVSQPVNCAGDCLMQDGSEDAASDSDSESEAAPAPEALARYLAIRRYTATGGAGLTPAMAVSSSSSMKTPHGT